jgi:hypothetical protein
MEKSGRYNAYSDNDYNLFPRYNVILAIQQGVEALVGQSFTSFEVCKRALVDIGQNSNTVFTVGSIYDLHLTGEGGGFNSTTTNQNPIEKNAMNEERIKFIEFVNSMTIKNMSEVEPLPYRHRLSNEEMLFIRERLLVIWNYDGDYWNPLDEKCPVETVFVMKDYLHQDDYNKIVAHLISISKSRIYEVSEDRVDYEIEFDSFNPDLYETIVSDNTFEWVIYGSHEGTLTFGGKLLTDFVKNLFAYRQELLNKWDQNWI